MKIAQSPSQQGIVLRSCRDNFVLPGETYMEDRSTDIIKELVLRSISDDYEPFERVLNDVTTWATERGTSASAKKVIAALRSLINDGSVRAYFLSANPEAKAEAVAFSESLLDEQWFYVTVAGKELARSFKSGWITRK